jgi:hypothetical protein
MAARLWGIMATTVDSFNPYAPPAATVDEVAAPPPAERSAVPMVFGILSVIFAGLFLLFCLLAGTIGVLSRPRPPVPAERVEPTRPHHRHTEPPDGAMAIVGLGMLGGSIALLVIGIGQIRYRRWAARAAVVWSIAAPAVVIGGVVWAGMVASGDALFALIPTVVLLLPYPVLLLIFFTRPRVLASMR